MPFGQTAIDVDVLREVVAHVLQVAEQEAVREPERRAGPQPLEHLLVELGLRRVGDQQQDQVRLGDRPANISPSVPFCSVKPASRGRRIEDEPSRSPIFTLMSVPSSESRRFCACAGPCEPQPITPICLTPSNALGSSGSDSRRHAGSTRRYQRAGGVPVERRSW